MKGYAADHVFSREHQALRGAAQKLVEQIDELFPGTYRCHEVVRFVFAVLEPWALSEFEPEAKVVDGSFAGVDHSWIRLDGSTILDVYSVGRLPMVQLVDVGTPTLMRDLYVGEGEEFPQAIRAGGKEIRLREKSRTDIRTDVVDKLLAEWRVKTHVICEMWNDRCWMCGSDE